MRFLSYNIHFNFSRFKRAVRRRPITLFSCGVISACLVSSFLTGYRASTAAGPGDVYIPVALYVNNRDHHKAAVLFKNFQVDFNGGAVSGRYEILIQIELFKSIHGSGPNNQLGTKIIRIGFDKLESPIWTSVSPFNALLRTVLCTVVREHLGKTQDLRIGTSTIPIPDPEAKAYRMTFATLDHRLYPGEILKPTSLSSWVTRPEAMVCFSLAFKDPFDWALASQEIRDLDLSEETLSEVSFLHPRKLKP